MEQQNEQLLITASLISLGVYAEYLAIADLEFNQKKIDQICFLSEMMASYHCIGGYESDADMYIQNRYFKPLDELLTGKSVQESNFNEAHMKAIINGLEYYREELELECDPVYDQDIKLCHELEEDIKIRLVQNEFPEWEHNMKF